MVADENIPYAREAFGRLGDLTLLPGRKITRADLVGADALIVRSVTRADAALLKGTGVRFVGSCTIGTDHLDAAWMEANGITWSSAPGCNAQSVVEWVFAGLMEHCLAQRIDWRDMTLGIVGHGNVGSRLDATAKRLGIKTLVCDPPKKRAGLLDESIALGDLLASADVVSLHVPLTLDGPDATQHLISWDELKALKPGSLVLNSCRGPVVDTEAALTFAKSDMLGFLLDVYEDEPAPNRDLVRYAAVSTPHIAGYSFEGKVNGTRMIYEWLARGLGQPGDWNIELPAPDVPNIQAAKGSRFAVLHAAMRHAYPIMRDTNALRTGADLEDDVAWAAHFDGLRKNYPVRREFANYTVSGAPAEACGDLRALGFRLG